MKPQVPVSLKFSSPLDGYRTLVRDGVLTHDPAQELAAEKLEILHARLKTYEPGKSGGWRSLFRREKQDAPQGLYIYGGVGRGKSMLMDLFFASTSFAPKRRVHFHAFMLEVHETVHQWRKLSPADRRAEGFEADDPIPPVAAKVAREAMLLCFDEFQVTDVADAMILGRLFRALFELGVVIGRAAKAVPADKALDHVLGYLVVNDVSARDWQMHTATMTMGKSFDTHGPIGPWIVTADEISDPHALGLRCFVNGEVRQDSTTAELIHSIRDQIAYLSTAFTLEPGDILATGTPEGVGAARQPPLFLQPGDVVRCEVDGIGAIENPVVA